MENGTKKTESTNTNDGCLIKIVAFISHPISSILIGIFFTLFFFYFVERKEIEPLYSTNEINSIASQSADAPDFKVFWQDKQVENVESIEIVFWNNGRQFLGKSSISNDDPIQIKIPKGVEILQVEIVKTSRAELHFNYVFFPSNEDRKTIVFSWVGDEVLEESDGALIKVYFTGVLEEDFIVKGRVFGSKNGFQKVDWDKGGFGKNIINFTMIFLFLFLLVFYQYAMRSATKDFKELSQSLKLITIFLWIGVYVFIGLLIYTFSNQISFDTLPSWAIS